MENLFEQRLNAKIKEIAEKLVVNTTSDIYKESYPKDWDKPQWINYVIMHPNYIGDDIWFLDLLLSKNIKRYGGLIVWNIDKNLSRSPLLTDALMRKYKHYLCWADISGFRKMSFRVMWLMREYIKPFIGELSYNKQISFRKYTKFVKYLNLESGLKRQVNDG